MSLVDGDFFLWQLVIQSGYLDLRNRFCCVDREFHRFIQQLKLCDFFNVVFTDALHVFQILNQARLQPDH